MRLFAAVMVIGLQWGVGAVQLLILRQRKLYREFWVAAGYLVLATLGVILLALEVRPRSLVRLLMDLFWIP